MVPPKLFQSKRTLMDTSPCEEERIDAGKEEEIKSTEGEQSSPQGAQQPLLLWVVYQEGDSLLVISTSFTCRPLAQSLKLLTGSWSEFDSSNHLKGCKWLCMCTYSVLCLPTMVSCSMFLSGPQMARACWWPVLTVKSDSTTSHQNSMQDLLVLNFQKW